MGIIEWATSPLGQNVPIHIAWVLIWVALIAGMLFLVVHAIYVRYFAKEKEFAAASLPPSATQLPARIPRHSLAARLFHWIMAASMFVLLFTAFLPKVGVQFDWVGLPLDRRHCSHRFPFSFTSFTPPSSWISGPSGRIAPISKMHGIGLQRFLGKSPALPRKFAKYPLENKLYHGVVMLTGLAVIVTGVFMMSRVRTIFFPRNPYLVQRHDLGPDVCAARTGRRRSHHPGDRARVFRRPAREVADYRIDDRRFDEPRVLSEGARPGTLGSRSPTATYSEAWPMATEFLERCDVIEECYEFMLAYAGQGLPSDRGKPRRKPDTRFRRARRKSACRTRRELHDRGDGATPGVRRADMKLSSRYSIATRRIRSPPSSWCWPSLPSAPS